MGKASAAVIGLLAASLFAAGPRAQSPSRPAGKSVPAPSQVDNSEEDAVPTVEVKGKKIPQIGAVVGDIEPEVQYGPADIQSFGVSTVTELLEELAPETRSDRGRGGASPVVLLNGRRISSFSEIQNIPTEAILRVDILPEEVSLKYGYTADQRVVNFVLRRRFRAVTGELSGGGATEGGAASGQGEIDQFRVRGDDRLNLDLKVQGAEQLTEADRGLSSSAGPFTPAGDLVGFAAGGEISPALSALVGRVVTIAGLPGSGASSLSAFANAAASPSTADAGAFRTLNPDTRQLTANAVLARPGPFGSQMTLNGTLGATRSVSSQGLSDVALMVPVGDPFSPFSAPVGVDFGEGPLKQVVGGWTAHLGATVNRDVKDWRVSLTTAYDHSDSSTATGAGYFSAPLQAALNALSPAFNPFAPLAPGVLAPLAANTARALSDSANIQILSNGPLFKLPAGAVYFSGKLGDAQSAFASRSSRGGQTSVADYARNDFNAQANLDFPLAGGVKHVLRPIGELSVNLNTAVDQLSDFGTLATLGYGLNWTPATGVNLIVSVTNDHAAPSPQQLDAPLVATPGVRLYDFGQGQMVEVTQLQGGEAGLRADSRQVFKTGLTLKPFTGQDFTFTANYIDSRIKNAIGALPAATAAIEAALPNRFDRGPDGVLIEEDDRPVNFADQSRRELRWGFNFARPIGPQPPPRPERAAFRRRDGEGASPSGQGAGPGSGGRGGGARRGSFTPGAYAGGGRLQIALYHTVYFKDQSSLAPGGPILDYLNGAPLAGAGGQYQHEIEGQLGLTLLGFGGRISADWRSSTDVRGGSTGDLSFSDVALINLRLFENFGQQPWVVRRFPMLRGSRLTLNIVNLLDQRVQVHDSQGALPIVYNPVFLSPTGRTISLSFRKLFF